MEGMGEDKVVGREEGKEGEVVDKGRDKDTDKERDMGRVL